MDYAELRHHSEYSLMIGCGRLSDHVKRAAEIGMKTLCLTETDTMRHAYYIHEDCNNHGSGKVRPIFGTEFSVTRDMHIKGLSEEAREALKLEHKKPGALRKAVWAEERKLGLTHSTRLCARALTFKGLMNLYRMSSLSWLEGHFIRPRLDLECLEKFNEGISISIGGPDGLVGDYIVKGDVDGAVAVLERLKRTFEGRMWLELQPHPLIHGKVNRAHIMLSEALDIPLIAVNDTHYVRADDTDAHTVILCMRSHKTVADPDHPLSPAGYHIRTGDEMLEAFRENHPDLDEDVVTAAIERTVAVAEAHTAKLEIDRKKALVPFVEHEYGTDDNEKLKQMCIEGWGWRDIPERSKKLGIPVKAYSERLHFELGAIQRQNFPRYFLIVHDLIGWSREHGIMTGPGRGSAAGSLVCYLTGITSMDPLEHKLMFERFISPQRIDMPDIDMDFEDVRRQEVIDYLHQKYGHDRVCHIGTFGRMKGKACLKDVSRVLDVPYSEVNAVTKAIIERSSGDERASQTVEDSFKDFEVCRQFDARNPKVLPLVIKLEGCLKQIGVHAAGIIPCPVPLGEVLPVERHVRRGLDVTITGLDMWGAEAHGVLKLDVLGLRTLSVLRCAQAAVKERHGVDIDFERLDLNDQEVLDMFTAYDYVGIFQYDSTGARSACDGIVFTHFEDVAALTALNRPGTMRSGLATEYKKRKQDPSKIKPFHPLVDEICAETLGILVYQEQVLKIFVQVAGYEPGTADSLRKKIAKKWGEEAVGKEREKFIEGAVKKGVPAEDAGKLMDNITFFGCMAGSTLVRTPYGPQRIDTIVPGMEVLSHTNRGLVYNRVKAGGPTGVKEVFDIIFDDGTVETATATHNWLTEDGWATTANLLGRYLVAASQDTIAPEEEVNGDREDVLHDGMRAPDLLQGDVLSLLSATVPSSEDGARSSGRGQRSSRRSGEGLEARLEQGDGRGRGASRGGDEGRPQSGVVGWQDAHRQGDARARLGARERTMREVLQPSQPSEPASQSARASRSPQEQGPLRQQHGEPGGALPMVPHGGRARGGTLGRRRCVSLKPVGCVPTYDLEMEHKPANYAINSGLISHNSYGFNKSHATAYGAISYWSMWLKCYYPTEFMWASMFNEPMRPEITRFAKEAQRLGINVLPPDINSSGTKFSIDADNNIRASLADVKNIGPTAIRRIEEEQPFSSLVDFMTRVSGRAVNSRVLTSLIKSGALLKLLPNTKWSLECLKDWLDVARKKKLGWEDVLAAMVDESTRKPDYSEEDLLYLAGEVSPLGGGKHPLEIYKDLFQGPMANCKFLSLDDEYFWDRREAWIRGVMIEIRHNSVGDFHTVEPDEAEKQRIGWGKRYANVNIEDASGVQHRMKVDVNIFEDFRQVLDRGIGTVVAAKVTIRKQFHSVKIHYIVDLEEMRQKHRMHIPFSKWELCFTPQHPVAKYTRKSFAGRKGVFNAIGLITDVKRMFDKNGNEMGFFGFEDCEGAFLDAVVFHSVFEVHGDLLKRGDVIRAKFRRDGQSVFLHDEGVLERYGSIL